MMQFLIALNIFAGFLCAKPLSYDVWLDSLAKETPYSKKESTLFFLNKKDYLVNYFDDINMRYYLYWALDLLLNDGPEEIKEIPESTILDVLNSLNDEEKKNELEKRYNSLFGEPTS